MRRSLSALPISLSTTAKAIKRMHLTLLRVLPSRHMCLVNPLLKGTRPPNGQKSCKIRWQINETKRRIRARKVILNPKYEAEEAARARNSRKKTTWKSGYYLRRIIDQNDWFSEQDCIRKQSNSNSRKLCFNWTY